MNITRIMLCTKFTVGRSLIVACRRSMSSSAPLTEVDFQDGVRTITLNHPKTRNALSMAMMERLIEDLTSQNDDPSLRVIVLSHVGPVFSSGHDLRELSAAGGADQHRRVFSLATRLMAAVLDSPVPVLARVDGVAAAAGCQLVAQCDFALCTNASSFSTPGASVGIFCSTPGVALARSMSKSCALHMLLTGMSIGAVEAREAGLVVRVCEDGQDLDHKLEQVCRAIVGKSRAVIQAGRNLFHQQIQLDVRQAYSVAGEAMARSCSMPDGREGIDSFINKRKPRWNS